MIMQGEAPPPEPPVRHKRTRPAPEAPPPDAGRERAFRARSTPHRCRGIAGHSRR
ncbi:hypothetical protein GCM10022224_075910 [Nonomuraea antimicrobica]|uniref:Uncharacterized protein n=1 Tax=Nonomuraea antimicrobica TaxID=561173 RepID=A0ABP7D4W7_9ACTN